MPRVCAAVSNNQLSPRSKCEVLLEELIPLRELDETSILEKLDETDVLLTLSKLLDEDLFCDSLERESCSVSLDVISITELDILEEDAAIMAPLMLDGSSPQAIITKGRITKARLIAKCKKVSLVTPSKFLAFKYKTLLRKL